MKIFGKVKNGVIQVQRFFKADLKSKAGREKRLEIIKRLIFWCTDEAINQVNIDSYLTRMTIIDTLFNQMFQNSLVAEGELIMTGLRPIVFSRITHTTHKGEPSPLVHDVIIKAVGRLLASHYNEVNRLSHASLDKMTKVQIIREIQKAKKGGGSLAFSAELTKKDEFQHKFPLPKGQVKLLNEILKHYSHSGWPDSREICTMTGRCSTWISYWSMTSISASAPGAGHHGQRRAS